MRKSFCLSSVSSFKDINTSPLNRSTSKNLWSFSKEDRFHNQKVYCDRIYNIPGLVPRKYGVSIGKGSKSDFTKDLTVSPPASKYTRQSFFDDNKSHRRGYSMGLSREKMKRFGHIELEPLKVPGPGAYNSLRHDTNGVRYSMRKKTKVLDKLQSIESQNDNPGPGRYQNPETLSPTGKYTISKHSGTGATLFNPRRSARFFQFSSLSSQYNSTYIHPVLIKENQIPGPGSYRIPPALTSSSHYVNSKHEGTGSRIFSVDKKVSKFDQLSKVYATNPGPGSYRSPSQFGHYDGEVYSRDPAPRTGRRKAVL